MWRKHKNKYKINVYSASDSGDEPEIVPSSVCWHGSISPNPHLY
jgi:hypothetical protein